MTLSPGSTGSLVSVYLGRMPLPVILSPPSPSVGALKKKKSIHPSHSFPPQSLVYTYSYVRLEPRSLSRSFFPLSLSPTRLHSNSKHIRNTALSELFRLYDRDSIAPSFSQPHISVTQFTVGLL